MLLSVPVAFVVAGSLRASRWIFASRSPEPDLTRARSKSSTLSRKVPLRVIEEMPTGASTTLAATKSMSAFTAPRRVKSISASGIRRADLSYWAFADFCSAFTASPVPVLTGIPNTTPRSLKSSSLDFSATVRNGFLSAKFIRTRPVRSLLPTRPVRSSSESVWPFRDKAPLMSKGGVSGAEAPAISARSFIFRPRAVAVPLRAPPQSR